jgi:hypothetical protein
MMFFRRLAITSYAMLAMNAMDISPQKKRLIGAGGPDRQTPPSLLSIKPLLDRFDRI